MKGRFSAEFFAGNRERLCAQLGDGPVVLSGYDSLQKSADMAHSFTQEANFWYLTGIRAPGWWVIISNIDSRATLVRPEKSQTHILFDGALSVEDALSISGANEVVSEAEALALLGSLAKKYGKVYGIGEDPHKKYYDFLLNPAPARTVRRLKRFFTKFEDCRLVIARLRASKQPEELGAIREAIGMTVDGFSAVKKTLETFHYEYEVEAEFSHYFRKNGADGHAYEPIVANAHNACTLHYVSNADPIRQSSLLLMDIGASVDGYAADITRTYAVGDISDRAREVHTTVSAAHEEIIALLRPGLAIAEYQERVETIMRQAVYALGLTNSPGSERYYEYFPHAISHGLGVDVHDSLGRPDYFLPNMVLTVEPGIYIPQEGIGVRIEDDILITDNGYENLSGSLSTAL